MGTILSVSPATKEAILEAENGRSGGKKNTGIKRTSVMVSALTLKRLVASSTKMKSAKKVSPDPQPCSDPATSRNQVAHLNKENTQKSLQQTGERKPKAPIPVPVPTVPNQAALQSVPTQIILAQSGKISSVQKQPSSHSLVSPRRIIIQASTGELLRCLADFVCRRCPKVKELTPGEVILWFRNVDRTMLIQGWQDMGFITPANLVFVYLLCQDTITEEVDSAYELQGVFLSCLYLSYSYMGNEISYPLHPFMIAANRDVFWDRAIAIINSMSAKMLLLNSDPHFFTEVFQELKNHQRDGSDSCLDR